MELYVGICLLFGVKSPVWLALVLGIGSRSCSHVLEQLALGLGARFLCTIIYIQYKTLIDLILGRY